jgi:hypothetical protein
MGYPDNILDRYRRIDALAQQGIDGERVSANNARRGMEEQYPGIREQVFPPPRAAPGNDAPYLGPYSAADSFGRAAPKPSWRDRAQEAMGWAARVAAEVAAARDMETLASSLTEIHSKNLNSGKFQIAVRFPSAELGYHLSRMDPRKRAEFVEKVTSLFREELAFVLDPENGASYDD